MANVDGSIIDEVVELVASHFDVDAEQVTQETNVLKDLGADITSLIEFTSILEEAFEIRVPDADAHRLQTVHKMVMYVASKRAM